MARKLEITTAVAAACLLTSCSQNDQWVARQGVRVCRDALGHRIDDGECAVASSGGSHWFYIERGGAVPRMGALVTDGAFSPRSGGIYGAASEASVTRGGFGGFGERFGLFGRGG